jgi:hypothetical protein
VQFHLGVTAEAATGSSPNERAPPTGFEPVLPP